jgi:histidinol phosphatase-like PHP family hydrolase
MKYAFDHDLHIHTHLSLCSECPEQTTERILRYAKEEGLREVCVTDHYWDRAVYRAPDWYYEQDFAHIAQNLPLPQADGVRFSFGCETEMDVNGVLGIPQSRFDDFDFIIVPTTHLHLGTFVVPLEECETPTPYGRAKLWEKRLEWLLDKDLPFAKVGIAHLAGTTIFTRSREEYLATLQAIDERTAERLFAKASSLGVGIELNFSDMSFAEDEAETVLKLFRIAKYQGCKFYCGSDAHNPKPFNTVRQVFERAIDRLDLRESDKFLVGR